MAGDKLLCNQKLGSCSFFFNLSQAGRCFIVKVNSHFKSHLSKLLQGQLSISILIEMIIHLNSFSVLVKDRTFDFVLDTVIVGCLFSSDFTSSSIFSSKQELWQYLFS